MDTNPMLKSALFYHGEGLCVIPVVEHDKRPALAAWEEYQTRRSTEAEIRRWFCDGRANIGLVHGEVSGNYVALDIDHDAGILMALRSVHPYLFAGRVEQSGSGEGYHVPLRLGQLPDFGQDDKQGRPRGNRTWKTRLGVVNIRARFCQTVAPPSIHPSGNRYRFIQKGGLTTVQGLDGLIEWLDKLTPPPMSQEKQLATRPARSVDSDDLISAVKAAWPTALSVFEEFGMAGKTQDEPRGELRLLGNGGLLLDKDRQQWYCFSDEMGGGVFEAWGYCRFGSRYDKHKHFREVLQEMAKVAGIEINRPSPREQSNPVTVPVKKDEMQRWAMQYGNYWPKMRISF